MAKKKEIVRSMSVAAIENVFSYHPPKDDQEARYENIRSEAKRMARIMNTHCPESHEKSLAMFKLREAVMWANAAIACNE